LRTFSETLSNIWTERERSFNIHATSYTGTCTWNYSLNNKYMYMYIIRETQDTIIWVTCYSTHQEQALYSWAPVLHVLRLVLKEVSYHLREQRSVPLTIQYAQVKDLWHVEEIVIIDDATVDLWTQVVLLHGTSERTAIILITNIKGKGGVFN
jgi:hypothetical protein